ncbi:MAG TPA: phosphoribosyltransferase family protein [Arachidicoccus sp.]
MSYFEYRSFKDLNDIIIKKLSLFPRDIDVIVGIPRSGMLPANLLALYLHKPFVDIDSFVEGKAYSMGGRSKFLSHTITNRVLVIDDSIASGNALEKAKEKLKKVSDKYEIVYGAIYSTTLASKKVDVYCEIIDGSLVFEWNLFLYPKILSKSFIDIDGVLCPDPPIDDDGEIYLNYITNAPPLYIPATEVDTVITCRLEKYRAVTEKWLKRNDVKYKNLVMLDLPDKKAREVWGKYGEYKGEHYKKSDCVLFIESSLNQASDIRSVSNKAVFCTETYSMINSSSQKTKNKVKTFFESAIMKYLPNQYELAKKLYNKLKF